MDIWLFLFNQFFIDKKFRSLNIIFQYYKCTDLWHIFLTIFSGNNSNILISASKCIHVFKIFHWVLNYSRKFFYFLIRVRKKMKKQLVSRSVLFDNSGLYISECIPRYPCLPIILHFPLHVFFSRNWAFMLLLCRWQTWQVSPKPAIQALLHTPYKITLCLDFLSVSFSIRAVMPMVRVYLI